MEHRSKAQVQSDIRQLEARIHSLETPQPGHSGISTHNVPFIDVLKNQLHTCNRELTSIENAEKETTIERLEWNLRSVDLALLLGGLYEHRALVRKEETKAEFFDAIAKLFIDGSGKPFKGHALRTEFDRYFDSVTGRKKKTSVFACLKKSSLK